MGYRPDLSVGLPSKSVPVYRNDCGFLPILHHPGSVQNTSLRTCILLHVVQMRQGDAPNWMGYPRKENGLNSFPGMIIITATGLASYVSTSSLEMERYAVRGPADRGNPHESHLLERSLLKLEGHGWRFITQKQHLCLGPIVQLHAWLLLLLQLVSHSHLPDSRPVLRPRTSIHPFPLPILAPHS